MASSILTVRFTVTAFVPPTERLAVIGDLPQLGTWKVDKAVPMSPYHVPSSGLKPSFWMADVEFPRGKQFEYKFIRWTDTPLAESLPVPIRAELDLKLGKPHVILTATPSAPAATWEEGENRKGEASGVVSREGVLLLEPARFRERQLLTVRGEECGHTARYFHDLVQRDAMHYDQVLERVWIGSCPRNIRHMKELKALGVTVVVNLQMPEDVERHFTPPKGAQMDPYAHYDIYSELGMAYVWLQTFDFNPRARSAMMPVASVTMATLMMNPANQLYVHCTAGVGRSVSFVMAYLFLVLEVPLLDACLLMLSRRPVAYLDIESLMRAKTYFERPFECGAKELRSVLECKENSKWALKHEAEVEEPKNRAVAEPKKRTETNAQTVGAVKGKEGKDVCTSK